jgi:predicted nucleic acid-binding protein
MVARAFIDTNVLIYTLSADEPAKQRAALALLGTLRANRQGVLSTQVLQEYANTSRKKLRRSTLDIRADLRAFATFEVVNVTPAIIDAALEVHHAHSLSFYDALIVATAQIAGCQVLYSEDMNAGEIIGGVRIVNPFAVPQ